MIGSVRMKLRLWMELSLIKPIFSSCFAHNSTGQGLSSRQTLYVLQTLSAPTAKATLFEWILQGLHFCI